jgi:hypothetical protein
MDVFARICSLACMVFGGLLPAHAQLPDVLLTGYLLDAATGDTIPMGEVASVGVNGYSRSDLSYVSPYSGMNMDLSFGADQMLYFSARGYTTRMAELDLGSNKPGNSTTSYIELHMDVPMMRLADTLRLDTDRRRLGKCVLTGGNIPMKWTTDEAQQAFTFARMKEGERIDRFRYMRATDPKVQIAVFGKVKEEWTEAPLSGTRILVKGSDDTAQEVITDRSGFYRMALIYNRTYRLEYRSEGRLSKIVEIDTQGIPGSERGAGFGMNIDMRLFAEIPGEDLSFLQQPIGRAAYSADKKTIEWDMGYTMPLLERLQGILKKHRK